MANLLKRKPISYGDSDGLWSLVGAMKECQITLTKMGYTKDLDSTTNLLKVQRLLPTYMQGRWAKAAHEILKTREPIFKDLLSFVEKQAEVGSTMFGKQMGSSKVRDVKSEVRSNSYYAGRPGNQKRDEESLGKCVCVVVKNTDCGSVLNLKPSV